MRSLFRYAKLPAVFSLAIYGCGVQIAAAEDSSLFAGKSVFDRLCIYCHGSKGEGDGPAGLLSGVDTGDLSNKAYMSELSDQELYDRIAWGQEKFPYLQMPGWRSSLKEQEIRVVINYIRSLAVDKGPLTTPSPKQRENKFRNDPLERGRVHYLRYCSGCHGKSGDGDGEGGKNLATKPAALSDPALVATITPASVKAYLTTNSGRGGGRNMPVFEDDFKDKIKDITLYIKTLAK